MLSDARTDLHLTLAMVVACVIVLLVWLAPTSAQSFSDVKTAWQNFTHPWRDVQNNLGNAVAGLQGAARATTGPLFYGEALALGSQAATGKTEYLRIQAPPAKRLSDITGGCVPMIFS